MNGNPTTRQLLVAIAAGVAMWLLAVGPVAADPAPMALADSAQYKIEMIANEGWAPGSEIYFPLSEVNAWSTLQVPETITQPRVVFRDNRIEFHGMVDFLAMASSEGTFINQALAPLLAGKRPVDVRVRVDSAGGFIVASVEEARLSGVVLPKPILGFLTNTFFLSNFPEARFDEPVPLEYGIERLEVRPSGMTVFMKDSR